MPRSSDEQLAAACDTRDVNLVRAIFNHFAPPLPPPWVAPDAKGEADEEEEEEVVEWWTVTVPTAAQERKRLVKIVVGRALRLADAPLLRFCRDELGADTDRALGTYAFGHESILRELILAGVLPVDYEFSDGWGSIMDWAIYDGEYDMIDFLLYHGFDPYKPLVCGSNMPAYVAKSKDVQLAEILLAYGVDVEIPKEPEPAAASENVWEVSDERFWGSSGEWEKEAWHDSGVDAGDNSGSERKADGSPMA